MKRLVFWLLVLSLLGMTALAAPLEQDNLETEPLDAFALFSDGDVMENTYKTWVFSSGGTGYYGDGALHLETLDPDVPFTVRVTLADRYEADAIADMTGVAFYLENNSSSEAGVAFFGESFGGFIAHDNGIEGPAEHQLSYSCPDFYDITCYLVSLDGTITRAEEYYDFNNYGLASVPPEFKGWFLIDLENGGFNICYYGTWGEEYGFHDASQCENGRFERGVHGLKAVGFSVCADLAYDETFLISDYAFWTPKDGFAMPEEGESAQPTATPAGTPTEAPTDAATEAPQPTETPAVPPLQPASFPIWAWAAIGAAVIIAVCVILIVTAKKKKKS